MKERLTNFLQNNNKHQFGFSKGYSSKLALLEITEQIRAGLDKGDYALGLY